MSQSSTETSGQTPVGGHLRLGQRPVVRLSILGKPSGTFWAICRFLHLIWAALPRRSWNRLPPFSDLSLRRTLGLDSASQPCRRHSHTGHPPNLGRTNQESLARMKQRMRFSMLDDSWWHKYGLHLYIYIYWWCSVNVGQMCATMNHLGHLNFSLPQSLAS